MLTGGGHHIGNCVQGFRVWWTGFRSHIRDNGSLNVFEKSKLRDIKFKYQENNANGIKNSRWTSFAAKLDIKLKY